jgi:hypothetical protein
MREFRGIVKNGVIVLEDGGELPEGTKVRVIVVDEYLAEAFLRQKQTKRGEKRCGSFGAS